MNKKSADLLANAKSQQLKISSRMPLEADL